MDAAELRSRAAAEVLELGPIPTDPREREMWASERLDGDVWISPSIAHLLLDAAEECRQAGGPT